MNQLNIALASLLRAISYLRHPKLVFPLFVLAAGQFFLLGLLTNFHRSGLVQWMAPLMRAVAGDGAVHYPQFFLALPVLFNVGNLVLTAVLGAYVWGAALVATAAKLEGRERSGWREAWARFPALFLSQLPIILIAVILLFGPQLVFGGSHLGGNRLRLLIYGVPVAFLLFQAMFLFAPMRVLLDASGPFAAIRDSVTMWRQGLLLTLLLVILPTLLHLPAQWVLRKRTELADRFSFETIVLVIAADILLFLLTNFVLVSAATVAYQTRKAEL